MNQQHHRRGAGHALAALKMIEHGPVVADDHEQRRYDASHALDAEGGGHQQVADQAGEGGLGEIPQKGNQAVLQAQHPQHIAGPRIMAALVPDIHALPAGYDGARGDTSQQISGNGGNDGQKDFFHF